MEADGTSCEECAESDELARYIIRREDVLLVPGQYLPKVFRRVWPATVPPAVEAHLRPSEKCDPAKNLRLYVEETFQKAGVVNCNDSPIKLEKSSQRPSSLFVKSEFAPPPGGIAQAVEATEDEKLANLCRALARLPEMQLTVVTLWADGLGCKAIAARMAKSVTKIDELLQEALDALRRLMDELDDGWPGDPPD